MATITSAWPPARSGINEELYVSQRDRYYLVSRSQMQQKQSSARIITPEQAALWLVRNEYKNDDIPNVLLVLLDKVSE